MLANLFSNKKDNIRRCIILTLGIGFCVFLLFFNNFQRVQLVNREGTSFEKGIVTEIVDENKNTQESRQKIKVKWDFNSISWSCYGCKYVRSFYNK